MLADEKLGKTQPAGRTEIDARREPWRSAFEAALHESGIDDATARAEFLPGLLQGALGQIRLPGSVESAALMAEVVGQTLESRESARDGSTAN